MNRRPSTPPSFIFLHLGEHPVAPERFFDRADDLGVSDDQAHLAPLVELELPQALTADERAPPVAHDRAHMEPPRELARVESGILPFLFETPRMRIRTPRRSLPCSRASIRSSLTFGS